MASTSALPNDLTIAQRNKRTKRGADASTATANAADDNNNITSATTTTTTTSSASSSTSASQISLASIVSTNSDSPSLGSNDYVGKLKKSDSQPSLGNDFLTAHRVFGDYVRKHEIPRKVFHSSIGFITLYLYTIGIQTDNFPMGFHIAFTAIFTLDLIRLNSRRFNYLYCQVVGFLMRKKEVNSFNGVLWYILGLDFSFSFFSKDIALLSVLLLSWSDTAASTCGRAWGHLLPKITKNKSLAGSLAAFAVGVISIYTLYGYFIPTWSEFNRPGDIYWTSESSYLNIYTLSLLGGFIASLSEGIDVFNLDDNFTIPVLSSVFFYAVITLFHK